MRVKFFLLLFIFILPGFLMAHGSHGNGVMEGFTHPIFGIDHFVAILAAGILGYLLSPSRWFLALIAFISLMIIGGILGIGNEATFAIEKVIAFSVFSLGIVIAFRWKVNLMVSLLILGVFGFFHGYAHGAEMSESNTALKYISGYSLGAALVGVIGMLLSRFINTQHEKETYISILGGIIGGCGIMMLIG